MSVLEVFKYEPYESINEIYVNTNKPWTQMKKTSQDLTLLKESIKKIQRERTMEIKNLT